MTSYWVQVAVERPSGLADLDDLQMRGVGSLLAEMLERIDEILGPQGERLTLDDYRVATYPQGTFVTLNLDAPSLVVAEEGSASVVGQILEEVEPLAEWEIVSSEVQLTTDDLPDAEDEESEAEDGDDTAVPTDEEVEEFRTRIVALAPRLRAFGLDAFGYEAALGAESPIDRSTAELAAGALVYCIDLVMEELFEDLKTLQLEDAATVADAGDVFMVLDELPTAMAAGYSELFVKKFVVSAAAITGRLTVPDYEPPACVAEELALRLLIDRAEPVLDVYGLDTDEVADAYEAFYKAAFDSLDHEMLYDTSLDGIADDPEKVTRLGAVPIAAWFTPFGADHRVHPYAEPSP